MASVILDFYDEDASSSLLGSLDDSDLETFALRPALFDLGALVFMVPKQVAEDNPTLLRKTNLVRVRFPTPMGSTRVWVGVLKDTRSVILSKGEEAGEYVEWTAPGGLFLLSYGALGTASTVSDQPARGSLDDVPARDWIWINEPYGAIITRVIEEGRHSPFPSAAAADSPFEDIDIDFDRTTDSAGNPWATIAEEFRVPIGSNMLDTIAQLATAGDVFLVMDPDLTLHAYQQYSDFAEDRTGGFSAGNVRWERGTNILTELSRQSQAIPATHLIQRDSDGNLSTEVASGYTSGREHYYYAEADSTNDDATLNKIAQRTIDASAQDAEQIAMEVVPGNDDATGEYFPFADFNNGDLVTLDTGSGSYDFDEASLRVVAFRITLDQASKSDTDAQAYKSLHVVVELAYRPLHTWSTVRSQLGDAGATPGCNCLRFCTPAYPGTGSAHRFYPDNTTVAALSGLTADASWESPGSYAFKTLKTTPDGDYPAATGISRSATGTAGGADHLYGIWTLLMDATMASIIAAGGGYVRGQIRARARYGIGISESSQDMISQIGVRVTQGASTTIRGTALALHSLGSSAGSSKWPAHSTKANKQFPPAAASNVLSAVPGAAAGDYLVVEIGSRNFTTVTSGGTIGPCTDADTDLPSDDSTESPLNSWIEIGQTGTGATEGCPILDTVLQGAEQPGDSEFAAHWDHQHAHGLISVGIPGNYHSLGQISNYIATGAAAPGVGDDEDDGYRIGTHWLDTATGDIYIATDVSAGAAVWEQLNVGASSGTQDVRKNSTGTVFSRTRLNLIEGTNVTLTVADDAGNDEVDITIAAASGSLTVEEEDASPSVGSVSTIQVPNGTLTNDGGGTVSLGYAASSHTHSGGGGLVVPDLMNSLKASADTPDDDFPGTSLDGKWTKVDGTESGIGNLLASSGAGLLEVGERSSWLAMQVGTAAGDSVELRQDYTLPDGACICAYLSMPMDWSGAAPANNEIWTGIGVNDNDGGPFAGTSGQTANLLIDTDTGAFRFIGLSATTPTYIGINMSQQDTWAGAGVFLRIDRSGLNYDLFFSLDGFSWSYIGRKTMATAANNIWLFTWCNATMGQRMTVWCPWIRQGTALAHDPWPL